MMRANLNCDAARKLLASGLCPSLPRESEKTTFATRRDREASQEFTMSEGVRSSSCQYRSNCDPPGANENLDCLNSATATIICIVIFQLNRKLNDPESGTTFPFFRRLVNLFVYVI
ncbi:hypothetical protein [Brenneria rubrifaciens]|uniref:Uncharacterized protein n=1 Tax=Brenneria rubrifaciens TaxID=55213 RepID=A0A4P8QU07_9GAMM|nr:hypothetical protein [Brenneria rubrifaciens]QCR07665.1 hypothetical protein EH207_03375 [Brenneria rubrifaciens]